ncbi:hypothetical protein ACO22_07806 [Paracoccidioides brasiliensis]|uniref:Uncharacterized protein n=1 Tax=Paracoccidioides brasiliensis TaxID=121759 RepID=A0A1D2J3M5_PARBR|nr:hypothetical protein ACO22_07806 [Paracoccidioides brasiliensis]ODH49636.1 hypothetical protein GX48_04289 [Paracoccidioides brasiliensis]
MLSLVVELENRDYVQIVFVKNVLKFISEHRSAYSDIPSVSSGPAGLQNLSFTSKRVDYGIYHSRTDTQKSHTRNILTMRIIDMDDHRTN